MRKIVFTLATLTVAAIPVVATATSAEANPGSPNCVTRAEYSQVHRGMTKAAVDREFGIRGHREAGAQSGGFRSEVWSYKTCQRFSAVATSFGANPGGQLRLKAKSAVWSY